ncbi:MAG: DUF4382 domain-containing protein [Haloferacaceae archaeon]
MKRRTYLTTTAGIATATTIGIAGCVGTQATGTLATRISDRPGDIDDFESCVVTVTEVWIKPADGELKEKDIDDAQADLVDLQGEQSALLGELDLETGAYEFVQLQIGGVDATLDGGGDATVEVPGDAPLKFERFQIDGETSGTFEIRENERTTFTADFSPVKRGQTGTYVLQPVAEEVTVSYESTSTETAQNGTTTDTTASEPTTSEQTSTSG